MAEARALLAGFLGGQFQRRSLLLEDVVIDVLANLDATDGADPGDDFVRSPVLVELEPAGSADQQVMVDVATRILTAFWDGGRSTVAACDFEDDLPWGGGIERLRGAT